MKDKDAHFKIVITLLLIIATSAIVHAQLETGVSDQFASYWNAGFDAVSLSNLNVHFTIPIVNKHGRKVGLYYNLAYDSLVWVPVKSGSTTTWTPIKTYGGKTNWGWTLDTDAVSGMVAESSSTATCEYWMAIGNLYFYANFTVYSNFVYYDASGASHGFYNYWTGGCPPQTTSNGMTGTLVYGQGPTLVSTINIPSQDGTGYVLNATSSGSATITTRSGQTVTPPINAYSGSGTIKDPNGNQITFNSNGTYTDTTGNTVLTVTGTGTPSSPRQYTYPVVGNQTPSPNVELQYTTYQIQTNFQCAHIGEYGSNGGMTANLVSEIDLPGSNGRYVFTYEQTPNKAGYYTGRMASVTLPTGGVINYTYPAGSSCPGGIQTDGSGYKLVRTTNDHIPNPQITFDRSTASQTVVTTPDSTTTTVQFTNFYETKRTISTGGTTLRTIDTCYNTFVPDSDCTGESPTQPFTEKAVYLTLDNQYKSEVDSTYGSYGEPLVVDEYDFNNPNVGTFLRETVYSYQYGGSSPVLLTDVSVWTQKGQKGVRLSEVAYGHDSAGNLTSTKQGPSGSTQLSSSINIGSLGMPSSTIDPGGHQTSFTYDSTNTFPAIITLPTTTTITNQHVSHSVSTTYDVYTGLLTSSSDQNGNSTTYAYDSMWRPTQVNAPDGGETIYVYPSYPSANLYKVARTIDGSNTAESESLLDGAGRILSTGTLTASGIWIRQDTCYDNMGRVQYVSSPYSYSGADLSGTSSCPSTSSPGDAYTYDALGRVINITHVDGSSRQYSYTGRATSITEETNHSYQRERILQSDAIGRLTDVCEVLASGDSVPFPSPQTGSNCGLDISGTGLNGFHTVYAYNLLGQLTSVTQPGVGSGASRSWQYDTLQRVTQEITPEAGTVTYTYDPAKNADGMLTKMTRPAPNANPPYPKVDTIYSYDEQDRITNISYLYNGTTTAEPNTPIVNYLYDLAPGWGSSANNLTGQLTEIWTASSTAPGTRVTSNTFDYDQLGRVTHNGQCTPNTCYEVPTSTPFLMTYTYNYVGGIKTSYNSASAVTFTNTYDVSARLSSLASSRTDAQHPSPLISNIVYSPFGVSSDTLGNGISETYGYGNPGSSQLPFLNSISATKNANTIYSLSLSTTSKGVVYGANDYVNGNWSYGYDSLDRIVSASKNGTAMNWQYDVPGNRWRQNFTTGSGPHPSYLFTGNASTNNNRIDTASYDQAGNLLADFSGSPNNYLYDAEGRVFQVSGGTSATYVYDGLGRRVKGPSYEEVYDLTGHPVSLLDKTTDAVIANEIFADGRHLGTYFNGNTYFVNTDHLGTERVRTDSQGTVCQTTTNLPFGDAQTNVTSNCSNPYPRTLGGMEYDSQTSLGHTQFRKYYSTPGRWMTPDPAGSLVADLANPQRWNRYSYVRDNPGGAVDPLGLCSDPTDDICLADQDPSGGDGLIIPFNLENLAGPNPSISLYYNIDVTDTPPDDADTFQFPSGGSLVYVGWGGGGSGAANNGFGKTPVHGLWTYGNWCGAGGSGKTISPTDDACRTHDLCYAQAGFTAGSNFQGPNAQLQACNQALCNAVRARRGLLNMSGLHSWLVSVPPEEVSADGDIDTYFTWVIAPWGNACH